MLETNLTTAIKKLLAEKHLLSANQLLEYFKQQGHTYNKTSVYRALDTLLNENSVCRHYFGDGEAQYELREHHHTHLVCTSCGNVATAECSYVEPSKLGSFKPDHHHTTVFGLCENCHGTI